MMQDLRQRQQMVELNLTKREASIDGIPLALGEKEYVLLQALTKIARGHRCTKAVSIAELLKNFHVSNR